MLVLKTRRQKLERVLFSPDGQGLVTAGKYGVFWWPNPISCPKPEKLETTESFVTGLSPDGRILIYECVGNAVRIYDTIDREKIDFIRLEGYLHTQTGTISPVQAQLIRRSEDNTSLFCWDVSRAQQKMILWQQPIRPAWSWYVFTRDGKSLLQMEFYSRPNLEFQSCLILRRSTDGSVERRITIDDYANCLPRWSEDGEQLAYHTCKTIVVRSRSRDYKLIARMQNPSLKYLTDVAFHPSGRWLVATCNDDTVRYYDTISWQLSKTYNFRIGRIRSIAFSHDGTLAAAGSDTGKIVVWDVDE